MNAQLLDIEYHLPDNVVTNAQIAAQYPHWNIPSFEKMIGIRQRHIASAGETALDLAETACRRLLQRHQDHIDDIDCLLFCTQTADHLIPGNANLLQSRLSLRSDMLVYDFNAACAGFVMGLAMASAFIRSKAFSTVLLVTADTYSKYINPADRSTRLIFGDGAAATLITRGPASTGIAAVACHAHGNREPFHIAAGGTRLPPSPETAVEHADSRGNVRSAADIFMDGNAILHFVKATVASEINEFLQSNAVAIGDIDLFVFHQASKLVLDALAQILGIAPQRCFRNLESLGNIVSASIPVALKDAIDTGQIRPGSRVLLAGFGAGLSCALAIVDF